MVVTSDGLLLPNHHAEKMVLPDAYYDDTDLEDLYQIPVILKNPTWKQKKEIELFKTLYRGVMMVYGKPRSGKDLFGVVFSFLNKLFFGRPILLDFKPKRLFSDYIPFDPLVFLHEINKMARKSTFRSDNFEAPMQKEEEDYFKSHATEWLNSHDTIFKEAILYLSELKRYCYKRNPHSRMNKFIGALCDIHGHLNLLILGTHTDYREIDQYSFLSKVSIWAHCKWSLKRQNNTRVIITRGAYISELGSFDVGLKPFVYWVDGAEPRNWLGGDIPFHLYNTQNEINLKPVLPKEMSYAD